MATKNRIPVTKAVYGPEDGKGLHLPLAMEDGHAPGMARAVIFLGCAFLMAFVLWGSVTQFRELTMAPGEVKPVGSVHTVQHLEGGQVFEISAKEGQVIEKGAAIVRLQPTAALADLDQLKVRSAALTLQIERVDALLERRKPDFAAFGLQYPILRKDQTKAYEAAVIQAQKARDELGARIQLRIAEQKAFADQIRSIEEQAKILDEQITMKKDLYDQQLVAKSVYLEVLRQREKLNEGQVTTAGQLEAAKESLIETRIKLAELDTELDRQLSENRGKLSAELEELREVIRKHNDRVKRLVVRAPVRGVVQSLAVKSIGQVIRAGEAVATVVPLGQELVAEVQIRPDDIGHLAVGFEARVKVTTFDPVRYKPIEGRVRHISPTTFLTDKGEPYYKGIVALDQNHVGSGGSMHQLLPGMLVQAEIVTGTKSLVRYLLRPIYRSFSTSFSER
ncbi:MAG: HlyD family type I secretion periplasmic adaptor subunit [Alphaproteobacteria bacterium]|nr:HlyD family type I secretion periplasmic adaptor subunit [Alphaproteobacteria bacterium]